MSSSLNFHKVDLFNKVAGVYTQEHQDPNVFQNESLISLRLSLIEEEIKELQEATSQNNHIEVIDALADILYVVYGMGSSLGLKLINEHTYKVNEKSLGVPDDSDLNILQGYFHFLKQETQHKNFLGIQINLMSLIDTVYIVAMKLHIDINKAFDIVHNSNMSKFPETEELAQKTVDWYLKNENRYDSPSYRFSEISNRYVVYNKSTGKILKSISYVPACFDELFM